MSILLMAFSNGCIFVEVRGKQQPTNNTLSLGTNMNSTALGLAVVWSSADRDVAAQVCLSYVEDAVKNKRFDKVALIVWGPSIKLLANDRELQSRIELLIDKGVKVQASADNASSYGVTDSLKELGIELSSIGAPLSNMIGSDNTKVITF
jgi:hypothetical protein